MKSLRFLLSAAVLLLAMSLAPTAALAQSDAQKSFTQLKTLAGVWKGSITTTPPMPEMDGKAMWVTLRVTSRGNALIHEMKDPSKPDDVEHDDPITTMYLDGGRLLLTHYCDAGNRPRMSAKLSPDGKTVEFELVDVSGGNENGHMHHSVFTLIDANHHTEDWTYMMPGDKPVLAHLDLQRTK
jgi:hypothetical protein